MSEPKPRLGKCHVCAKMVESFYSIRWITKEGFCSEECFGKFTANDKMELRRLLEADQISKYGRVINPIPD